MNEEYAPTRENELNSTIVRLSSRLMEIEELYELTGYNELRLVRRWCEKNKIVLFSMGKKTYTIRNCVEMYIENQLREFVTANYSNPEEIMNAVINDDEIKPVLNKQATIRKVAKPEKKKMSAASMKFLNDE